MEMERWCFLDAEFWYAVDCRIHKEPHIKIFNRKYHLGNVFGTNNDAIELARRMVASVNFCMDMPIEQLEEAVRQKKAKK